MTAKMIGKPFRSQSRPDFEQVKVDIMRWCLRIKLAQNFISFGKLLESTGTLPIVEDSHKDAFWGATRDKQDPSILKGVNALGRLLMELRQQYFDSRYSCKTFQVDTLNIPDFKLLDAEISGVDERTNFINYVAGQLHVSSKASSERVVNHILVSTDNIPLSQKAEGKPDAIPTRRKAVAKANVSELVKESKGLEKTPRKKAQPKKIEKPLTLFSS